MKHRVELLAFVALLSTGMPSHAVLKDMGSGLIMNPDRGIMWYDFTYAAANWDDAMAWAAGLSVYDSKTGKTYDDWRLTTAVDMVVNESCDGSNSQGYNVVSSELGYLFFSELGNLAQKDTSCNVRPDGTFGLSNVGPFANLIPYSYWSGTEYLYEPNIPTIGVQFAWRLDFSNGGQWASNKGGDGLFAIAVRDIGRIPEPGTLALLGVGLAGIAAARKSKVSDPLYQRRRR